MLPCCSAAVSFQGHTLRMASRQAVSLLRQRSWAINPSGSLVRGSLVRGSQLLHRALCSSEVAAGSDDVIGKVSGVAVADDLESFGGESLRPGVLAQLEARLEARLEAHMNVLALHTTRLEAQDNLLALHTTRLEALDTVLEAYDCMRALHTTGLEALQTRQDAQGNVIALHTTLLRVFARRYIKEVAGEILKWSVKKQEIFITKWSAKDEELGVGDGRQFYDEDPEVQSLVLRGCRAFGEIGLNTDSVAIEIYKAMSQNVIKAQITNVRCLDIYELDRAVVTCLNAINGWPELEDEYPLQSKIL